MVWQPMATGAPFSSVIEACLQVYKRSNSMIAGTQIRPETDLRIF